MNVMDLLGMELPVYIVEYCRECLSVDTFTFIVYLQNWSDISLKVSCTILYFFEKSCSFTRTWYHHSLNIKTFSSSHYYLLIIIRLENNSRNFYSSRPISMPIWNWKNFQDNWSELPSIREFKLEVKRNWENHFYPFLTRGYATGNLRICTFNPIFQNLWKQKNYFFKTRHLARFL